MNWEAGEGRLLRKRLRNPFLEGWRNPAKEVNKDNLPLDGKSNLGPPTQETTTNHSTAALFVSECLNE
jgi:hypothetical protein